MVIPPHNVIKIEQIVMKLFKSFCFIISLRVPTVNGAEFNPSFHCKRNSTKCKRVSERLEN